ncbi:hypothetical protein Tco_1225042, partial [Tanacetum coccineum]
LFESENGDVKMEISNGGLWKRLMLVVPVMIVTDEEGDAGKNIRKFKDLILMDFQGCSRFEKKESYNLGGGHTEEQRLCVWFVIFYTAVVELTLRVTINNGRRREVKYRQSQEVLVDIPERITEHGLSSEITQSSGGSSDTSEGSENSGSFEDYGSSGEGIDCL